jgi:hypothetical protein
MRHRLRRDERGASLILAIVFMVVVGAVGGGVLASISSGVQNGVHLATARNREYAADAAIESSIARVRRLGAASTNCASDPMYTFETSPSVDIHVDCANVPTVAGLPSGALALQNDVVFTACLASVASPKCPSANTIISAEVNFQANGSQVTTYVLSWSVNG